jgi:(p)ppGpp synthase/HD superfamily hydrolase
VSDLVERAAAFAIAAHGDQKRKYTGEPYVVHTQEVAAIVAAAGGTQEMIAAAHLHDVVEDTPATETDVAREFGPVVAELVAGLTDQIPLSFGNRKARKRAESDRLAACPADVQTIKLADIISNTASIAAHDPGFARVYLAEMRYLVGRLTAGDAALRGRARAMVGLPNKK